jgi:hypothetical protein
MKKYHRKELKKQIKKFQDKARIKFTLLTGR